RAAGARAAPAAARPTATPLGLTGVRAGTATAERHAAGLGPAGLGLVFLDPPYALAEEALAAVLGHLAAPGVLADGAVVVVERSTRTPEPSWPAGMERFARKDYGETAVYYAEPTADDPDASDSVSA